MTGLAACITGRFAVPVECCWRTFSPTRSVLLRTVPAFCAPPIGNSSDRRVPTLPNGPKAANLAVTFHMPAAAHFAAPAQIFGQGGRELGLPLPDGLIA